MSPVLPSVFIIALIGNYGRWHWRKAGCPFWECSILHTSKTTESNYYHCLEITRHLFWSCSFPAPTFSSLTVVQGGIDSYQSNVILSFRKFPHFFRCKVIKQENKCSFNFGKTRHWFPKLTEKKRIIVPKKFVKILYLSVFYFLFEIYELVYKVQRLHCLHDIHRYRGFKPYNLYGYDMHLMNSYKCNITIDRPVTCIPY